MIWGILVVVLIVFGLGWRSEERDACGAMAATCGLMLLVMGIVVICNTSVVNTTVYVTDIPGAGQLTKITSYAPGIRGFITWPVEVEDAYTLATKAGKVDISPEDAEKLLASK